MSNHLRSMNLLAALFLWFSLGCASFSDGSFRQVDGRFFDDRLIADIVDGQTTVQQVLAWFGPPESVSDTYDGSKIIRYHSVRTRLSIERRFLFRKIHEQAVEQELIITTSSGLVASHRYNSRSTNK